jgi:hypothetical protein
MESFKPVTYLFSKSLKFVFSFFSKVSNLVSTTDSSVFREASRVAMFYYRPDRDKSKLSYLSHSEVNYSWNVY